jgi:nicotinamidase-related amidase
MHHFLQGREYEMDGILEADNTALLIIDLQEKFEPVIHEWDEIIEAEKKLIKGCQILDIPMILTEQYPQGLGNTVDEVSSLVDCEALVKTCFSCMKDKRFLGMLEGLGRSQIMVSGIEAHVCVLNTVLELLQKDYEVYVIEDAISSRRELDRDIAFKRMMMAGAYPMSVESALFQLQKDSSRNGFKELSKIVK